MADNAREVVTIDNPPIASKINWTQIVSFSFGLLATLGLVIPEEYRVPTTQFLVIATPILTFILRTWFTGVAATTPQLKNALEDKGLKVTTKLSRGGGPR